MSASYFMLKLLKNNKENEHEVRQKFETVWTNSSNTNECRICLKNATIKIFDHNNSLDVVNALLNFGNIIVSKHDMHTKFICEACYAILEVVLMFRKTAKQTEKILNTRCEMLKTINEPSDCGVGSKVTKDLKVYSCKICKINFKSSGEYIKHKASRKHKNTRVQCNICKRLLTANLYQKHLLRHQASHIVCEVCGKLYRKDNLVRHLQLHTFELPFQCACCPYRGRFMESLKLHMRAHTGDKPYSCDSCKQRFLTKSNLNKHLLRHRRRDKPHKCIECSREFYTKKDMEVHFKADHAGIKDFVCRVCKSKYSTRKALKRHELRIHNRVKMAKGRKPLYLQSEFCNLDANETL